MPYQSFPGDPGDSDSEGKLRALYLPDLRGKSVLDVGCNIGFFCKAALTLGAASVTGQDQSPAFIEIARNNVPGVDFIASSWEILPDRQFDVIFLLSSLHYADDQSRLIQRLVDKLTPDGVLILEIGVLEEVASKWVEVQRGIDVRLFPTMQKIRDVLNQYSYRLIGPSVMQSGDPVARFVFHIRARRQIILACLSESGVGKSDLCRHIALASSSGIPTLSCDDDIIGYSDMLSMISSNVPYSPKSFYKFDDLSHIYEAICHDNRLDGFADLMAEKIGTNPLTLLEGSIPIKFRMVFIARLCLKRNFDIWFIDPARIRSIPLLADISQFENNQFQNEIIHSNIETAAIKGFIDAIRSTPTGVAIIGWGYNMELKVGIDGIRLKFADYSLDVFIQSRFRRPDAMIAINATEDLLGFGIELALTAEQLILLAEEIKGRNALFQFLSGPWISRAIIIEKVVN